MKIFELCSGRKCCPTILVKDNGDVTIGEDGKSFDIKKDAWLKLKQLIKEGVL